MTRPERVGAEAQGAGPKMPERPASELLRELEAAVTPGPWTVREGRIIVIPTRAPGERFSTLFLDRANAEATADLRNVLPALIELVEAAEAETPREHHRLCDSRSGGDCDCYMRQPIPAALADLQRELGGER